MGKSGICDICKSENTTRYYNEKNKIIKIECLNCGNIELFSESYKHDEEKPMMNLLPFEALEEVAKILNFGVKEYGKNTWKLIENPKERYEAALLRHLTAHKKGKKLDSDSGLSHLSHMACNALFMLWFEIQSENEI